MWKYNRKGRGGEEKGKDRKGKEEEGKGQGRAGSVISGEVERPIPQNADISA